jgi:hypothetical protein
LYLNAPPCTKDSFITRIKKTFPALHLGKLCP